MGINTNAPTTTLQINANNPNQSGLRLEKLTSSSPSTIANYGRVLTVDGFGNVVLTNDNGGGSGSPNTANNGLTLTGSNIQLGGPLVQNTQVALDNYTFKYTGPSYAGQTLRWQIEKDGRQKSWCYELAFGTAWDYFVPFSQSTTTQTGMNLYSIANTSAVNYGINNQIQNYYENNSEIIAYNASLIKNNAEKRYIAYSSTQKEYAKDNQAFFGIITPINRVNENKGLNLIISNANLLYGCDNEVFSSENAYGYRTQVSDIQNTGYGVYANVSASEKAVGVAGFAIKPSALNYGVYGEAKLGDINYGVYGITPQGLCDDGPSTDCKDAAGFFEGDLYSVRAFTASDLKLKTNINNFTNASSIIDQLMPKTYEFDVKKFNGMSLPTGTHYGLIAQDVEKVLPGLVKYFSSPEKYDSIGNVTAAEVEFKAVDYLELIPILLAAIKEQKQIVDSLLIALNTSNIRLNTNSSNPQKVVLENAQQIILDQNDPNPFSETTTINYSIPEEVKNAKIIFTNSSGVILRSLIINERGEGSLEIYGSNLSSGVYNYTLFIDGKATFTKKMVKQ